MGCDEPSPQRYAAITVVACCTASVRFGLVCWCKSKHPAPARIYAKELERGRIWGGPLELAIAAKQCTRRVAVLVSQGGVLRCVFTAGAPHWPLIAVFYDGHSHYDALVARDAPLLTLPRANARERRRARRAAALRDRELMHELSGGATNPLAELVGHYGSDADDDNDEDAEAFVVGPTAAPPQEPPAPAPPPMSTAASDVPAPVAAPVAAAPADENFFASMADDDAGAADGMSDDNGIDAPMDDDAPGVPVPVVALVAAAHADDDTPAPAPMADDDRIIAP